MDTNVLARFVVQDDPEQAKAATDILRGDVLITPTVLLETAWLLASRYQMTRPVISEALTDVVNLSTVAVRDQHLLIWALERMAEGADFADMLHLVESRDAAIFSTFDRRLAKRAGSDSPIEIEILGA